jgi:hypothetical protein
MQPAKKALFMCAPKISVHNQTQKRALVTLSLELKTQFAIFPWQSDTRGGNRWLPQTTCTDCACRSADFLPPSPPAEKATTRQDQAGQTSTGDGGFTSDF